MKAIALSNAEQGQEVEVVLFADNGQILHAEDIDRMDEPEVVEVTFVSWAVAGGLLLAGGFLGWVICMWVTL